MRKHEKTKSYGGTANFLFKHENYIPSTPNKINGFKNKSPGMANIF